MRRAAALCFCVLSWGCTEHDPENGRIGGPLPDANVVFPDASELDAAADAADADVADTGPDGEGGADADAQPPIVFCEAFKVMKVCRRCHQTPSPVGAPFPLQSWEDTQGVHLGRPIKDRMIRALELDFMPLTTPLPGVDPPVLPLDPSCKNTLLTWVRQGAQPVGGTDCDPELSCEGCPNFP